MMDISFGTDGWRARMGREFNFHNIRIVAQAYANFLKKTCRQRALSVIVNYDTRYLSAEFAKETAKILSLNNIHVLFPPRDTPSPAVSLAIVQNNLQGAICFTASFNELTYNGIKIFNAKGSPALPSTTMLLEHEIKKITPRFQYKPRYADDALIESVDFRQPYLDYLQTQVDFDLIRNARMKIIVDNIYGTSREYLDKILQDNDIDIFCIRNFSNSDFGGVIPSSTKENLRELSEMVLEQKADIGIATDIDSDRFGIVDNFGKFISANFIIPELIDYLITERHMDGDIVKSVSTTDNVDHVARYYHRHVHDTPVGFKFLADMLHSKNAFIGVESTNGASLNTQVAQKDGILFNLLILEMLAHHRLPLSQMLNRFYSHFPRLFFKEIAFSATPKTLQRYHDIANERVHPFAANLLQKTKHIDGIKYIFKDSSWLLIRSSGTRQLIRLYVESEHLSRTQELLRQARAIFGRQNG